MLCFLCGMGGVIFQSSLRQIKGKLEQSIHSRFSERDKKKLCPQSLKVTLEPDGGLRV